MTRIREVHPPAARIARGFILVVLIFSAASPTCYAQNPFPARDQLLSTVGADIVHDLRYIFRESDDLVYPAFSGYTGHDVRIGIFDQGINKNHPDFGPWRMQRSGASRFYKSGNRNHPHGTHVAAIAAAEGVINWRHGLPTFSLRGIAPHALIGDFQKLSVTGGYDVAPYVEAVLAYDTHVSNHSYEEAQVDYYSELSAALDELISGRAKRADGTTVPARPMVWASGKSAFSRGDKLFGYYSVTSLSKNAITVGSVDVRTGALSNSTALGPTPDGRLKPDVVAPGCHESWDAQENVPRPAADASGPDYDFNNVECGTSMAAPVVTGILALMMDRLNSMSQPGIRPAVALRPSTYKALLIHTARDLSMLEASSKIVQDTGESIRYHAGPDYATGYGMVDASSATKAIADLQRWKEAVFDPNCGAEGAGCVQTWHFWVPKGSQEVKATLAWDDPPGIPQQSLAHTLFKPLGRTSCADTGNDASALVHDLDLTLISPDAARTKIEPWVVPPPCEDRSGGRHVVDPAAVQPAVRGQDHVNNVEMTSHPEPAEGWWRVDVRMNEPPTAPQMYSLVGAHPFLPCVPPSPADEIPTAHQPNCAPPEDSFLRYGTDQNGLWTLHDGARLPVEVACRMTRSCTAVRQPAFTIKSRAVAVPDGRDLGILVITETGDEIKRLPLHGHSPTMMTVHEPGDRLYIRVIDELGRPLDPVRLELSFE